MLAAILWACVSAAPQPSVDEAVKLFTKLEDERAEAMLKSVLEGKPTDADAARAHLYVGLIRMNALDARAAYAEFVKALAIDPLIELPPRTSPKARRIFARAQEAAPGPTPTPKPQAPPPAAAPPVAATAPLVVAEPAPAPAASVAQSPAPGPSYVAPIVVGVASVVAAGVGIGLGLVSNGDYNAAVGDKSSPQSLADAQASGNLGLAADVCFAAAGVGAIAAVVLFLTASPGQAPVAVGVAPVREGAVAAVGGRF